MMRLFGLVLWLMVQISVLFVLRVGLILSGFFIVPFGLLFSKPDESVSDGRVIDTFPRWLWVWGNDSDGTWGDKRNWWDTNADGQVLWGILPLLRKLKLPIPVQTSKSFLSRYWWCAVRNPANNLRWVPGIACPVSQCRIENWGRYNVHDSIGNDGWQFVVATHKVRRYSWCGFYWVLRYGSSTRALEVRFGYKVKPAHATRVGVEDKGFTVAINPYKDIS